MTNRLYNYLEILSSLNLPQIFELNTREQLQLNLISIETLRSAAEKSRNVPKAPSTHDQFEFECLDYKGASVNDFILKRNQKPGENRDIILLGTLATARQFALAKIKSGMLLK